MLAILVYAAALGLPLYLLYRFHSRPWYWHLLAIVAAAGLGTVPIPPTLQGPVFDLIFGFVFVALLIWGVCGLLLIRPHREKHA
jgi:hypothetical protein